MQPPAAEGVIDVSKMLLAKTCHSISISLINKEIGKNLKMNRFGEANGPSIGDQAQKCTTYSSLGLFSDLDGAKMDRNRKKGTE